MAHRIERVNHLIRQEISELIQHQVKDPRLDAFISVTEVETSPDLKYARETLILDRSLWRISWIQSDL